MSAGKTNVTSPFSTVARSGLENIKTIEELDLKDKRVFIRLDLNVPMKKSEVNSVTTYQIADETRILGALPTIKYAIEKQAKIVLCSHAGRPKTAEDKIKMSLEPVGKRLAELLNVEVILIEDPKSDAPKGLLPTLRPNQILLLENVRFNSGEEENSLELAQRMASYTDVYINDAFGACHRAHATISALPSLIKDKAIGFLVQKEINQLDQILHKSKSPFVAILGGAKVSDKIGVFENLIDKVDTFIVGGAMAYTFLKAMNFSVGTSLVEKDKLKLALEIKERIEARGKQLLLPIDHIVNDKFDSQLEPTVTKTESIPDFYMGLDIGPQTLKLFQASLSHAKTVFWNGPMGVFEKKQYEKGTFGIAKTLADISQRADPATVIVGGGDSASAAVASGYADKMTHISTGGGASLEYLQGDKLPGLEALRVRK
jgi:phosphoglycerate kinase